MLYVDYFYYVDRPFPFTSPYHMDIVIDIDFIHHKSYLENASTMKLKLQNETEQKITDHF